ncbi:MAG: FAD-binding oxidoreductase [Pseudomonadota bacterium]
MKVSRLPVDTGISGWAALLPEPETAISLDAAIAADYLIIGAGFAGLSAARRISQLDGQARIVLLEAKRLAEGPAGRNSGFMIDLPHELSSTDYATTHENDLAQIRLNRQAIEFAADAAYEYKMPKEAFDKCGKINGAAASAAIQHNLNYAKHLDALGEPFEMLNAEQMQKLTGSRFYQSGIKTPGTALIQPAMYISALAKGLENRVSVFENSPVICLTNDQGSWIAETTSGLVQAPNVILATNGHVESFGFFKRQVFHVILYASMSRQLSEMENNQTGEANWGITPADPAATTMRKISGSGGTRIITRNQMTYSPSMSVSESLVGKMATRHEKSFALRYPELGNVEQEYSWAGRLCLSRNSAPAFGKIADGLYSACCQNGLGTAKGTLSGMAIAELAVEGETPLAKALINQGSPQKLPPAPLDIVGAKAFMRWAEFKARSEL